MAHSHLAYPYANALFEVASKQNCLDSTLEDLALLAMVADSADFNALITNPVMTKDEILETLLGVLKKKEPLIVNFLKEIQRNRRLNTLGAVFKLFEQLVLNDKNSAKGTIESPFVLSDSDRKDFEKLLSKKFGKNVSLDVTLNPNLIGGVKIFVNDAVIDASIKGGLEKMATQLRK